MRVDVLEDAGEAAFVAFIVLGRILVLLEALCLLVDGVVGQVHLQVAEVSAQRALVELGGKPGEALFVDEAPEWPHASHQKVYPQVKLQAIDQQWLVQVLLRHIVLALDQPVVVSGQEDALALAVVLWLDDERLRLPTVELLFEAFRVVRQHPCLREEGELFWQESLQLCQISCKKVLSRELLDTRHVVGPLVWFHLVEQRRLDVPVDPPHVPVSVLGGVHSKPYFFCRILQDLILCIKVVNGELPLLWLDVIVVLCACQGSAAVVRQHQLDPLLGQPGWVHEWLLLGVLRTF